MSDMSAAERRPFAEAFYFGELNRFVGSGGELLLKSEDAVEAESTRLGVGDRLIGLGITHVVESLSRPPGPESFRAVNLPSNYQMKVAARSLRITDKRETPNGYEFGFEPLAPAEFSNLLASLSDDRVQIAADTIPDGTYVLSILHDGPGYSLASQGDDALTWEAATTGTRHWNVGVGKPDDFWWAEFPSDDIGLLAILPPHERVGQIRFGLSLLEGSAGAIDLVPVEVSNPFGGTSAHDFCLSGAAVGVLGLTTPFPIGLRTEILFHPLTGQ